MNIVARDPAFLHRVNLACQRTRRVDLADAAGCCEEQARRYLEGLRNVSVDFIRGACELEGVSADWLLFGTGPMERGEAAPPAAIGSKQHCAGMVSKVRTVLADLEEMHRVAAAVAELREFERRSWRAAGYADTPAQAPDDEECIHVQITLPLRRLAPFTLPENTRQVPQVASPEAGTAA